MTKQEFSTSAKIALIKLINDNVLIQGLISLIIVVSICYMYVNQIQVPSELIGVLLLVLGFYFGGKANSNKGE